MVLKDTREVRAVSKHQVCHDDGAGKVIGVVLQGQRRGIIGDNGNVGCGQYRRDDPRDSARRRSSGAAAPGTERATREIVRPPGWRQRALAREIAFSGALTMASSHPSRSLSAIEDWPELYHPTEPESADEQGSPSPSW